MAKKISPLTIALSGMMAAVIFVATYFLKIPIAQGYIHLGDGFILLASAMLGWPAVISAALGSMLSDLLAGYSVYILPTFIIKALVAAIAVFASRRHSQPVQMFYMLLAEAVMVFGYFVTEWVILGFGLAAATAGILGNVLQGLSGVAIWSLLIPVANRIGKQPKS